jgi:two-component system, OmpR family, response regulator ResD
VHVRRLREKIESDPSQPRLLETVWGVGYRFSPPEPQA